MFGFHALRFERGVDRDPGVGVHQFPAQLDPEVAVAKILVEPLEMALAAEHAVDDRVFAVGHGFGGDVGADRADQGFGVVRHAAVADEGARDDVLQPRRRFRQCVAFRQRHSGVIGGALRMAWGAMRHPVPFVEMFVDGGVQHVSGNVHAAQGLRPVRFVGVEKEILRFADVARELGDQRAGIPVPARIAVDEDELRQRVALRGIAGAAHRGLHRALFGGGDEISIRNIDGSPGWRSWRA